MTRRERITQELRDIIDRDAVTDTTVRRSRLQLEVNIIGDHNTVKVDTGEPSETDQADNSSYQGRPPFERDLNGPRPPGVVS